MGYQADETETRQGKQEKEKSVVAFGISPDRNLAVRKERKEEEIEIVRADIEPVMYGNYDLNEVLFTVVKVLQSISRVKFYGMTMLTAVLKGMGNQKICGNALDGIPEFAALKNMPCEMIKAVIEWMISEHLILQTKGKYPVLHPTYEGLHYSERITKDKLCRLKKYLDTNLELNYHEDNEGYGKCQS